MSTTIQVDDPQGLINSLQERIKELEGQLAYARKRDSEKSLDDLAGAMHDTLKSVRGRYGVILLHVGREDFSKVREDARNPAERVVLNQTWRLASAPLPDDAKTALQIAAAYGDNRWF
jgi:hypothetical protein